MKPLLKKPRTNRSIDADELNSHSPHPHHHHPAAARSHSLSGHASHPSDCARPGYALWKGLGCWELTFEGQSAVLKHEQGIYYVAYLLTNPVAEPIHGLALALKIKALYADTANGETSNNGGLTPVQQRNLALDDAEAAATLRRKQFQLEAVLEDENESEPVKAEVLRDLQAIYEFQQSNAARTRDSAERATDAVRKALRRFHGHLQRAMDSGGQPHTVLRAFAEHLRRYLLIPSGRDSSHRATPSREGFGGCFIYEPPPGVRWAASVSA
jgi:hypothetical protein